MKPFPILPPLATFKVVMFCSLCMTIGLRAQSVGTEVWGKTVDGREVERVTLTNKNGLRVAVMSYGATLLSIETPDREGRLANITLSLGSFEEYEKGHPLLGSVVGRYANRIDRGGFQIDGKHYDLETVNRKTGVHIHGGATGFHKQLWTVETETTAEAVAAHFSLTSEDGHEGYPGLLRVKVSYLLSDSDTLQINYEAQTDKTTHINLTNHAYFNLGGAGSGTVRDHLLMIAADRVLEFDERKIPTGELLPTENTAFDFGQPSAIGAAIDQIEGGLDHCFVLDGDHGAVLSDPKSGRVMEMKTTKPGVQVYTANHLKPSLKSPQGESYGPHHGICLETQFFPDSPNQPSFPSSLLRPGDRYLQQTIFHFRVKK